MLDAAAKIWAKINEFVGRIDKLEKQSDRTQTDVEHMERELELLRKEAEHDRRVNGAIQKAMAEELAKQHGRITKLEGEKRGKAISAGIAKKQVEKLKEELRGPRDPKKRH